jgi:uncharacterized protein (DUF1800 family)
MKPEGALPAGGASLRTSAGHGWDQPLSADRRILHLLNRITFGPRSGDAERVAKLGPDAYLDRQLRPETIDDSALEARLASLPTLAMNTEELMEKYPVPTQAFRQAQMARAMESSGRPDTMMETQGSAAMRMTGMRRVPIELAQGELLRAISSERQLQEVMVQFWMNHFNVFAFKQADMWYTTSFERDTIRPRALGRFEDLLVATAQSPAMLFYLDNWMSSAPDSNAGTERLEADRPGNAGPLRPAAFGFRRGLFPQFGGRGQRTGFNRLRSHGLNENYGRELMELHTLGVNGGFTQQDVIEVARCLTGWTIEQPRLVGKFVFDARMHDRGEKVVLGHKIPAGRGMEDGLEVLHILATHPSTAQFISAKLCRRFVADQPPPALVSRVSETFRSTHGDLRAVVRAIVTSPEFNSQAAYRAKMKSPLELMASTLRALDGETDGPPMLIAWLGRMGEPMLQYQAPNGFPDRARTWVDAGSLLARLNFAAMVASNRVPGVTLDWAKLARPATSPASDAVLDNLAERITGAPLSSETRAAILKSTANGFEAGRADTSDQGAPRSGGLTTMAALVLASPEFQRR